MSFILRFNPRFHTAFSYHKSSVSTNMWQCLHVSLSFMVWTQKGAHLNISVVLPSFRIAGFPERWGADSPCRCSSVWWTGSFRSPNTPLYPVASFTPHLPFPSSVQPNQTLSDGIQPIWQSSTNDELLLPGQIGPYCFLKRKTVHVAIEKGFQVVLLRRPLHGHSVFSSTLTLPERTMEWVLEMPL